ncbi:hypothetical protein F4776DRAFT_314475 [Hypoxylon sp. NC0597]|nr:hypothetical protein F4776DRAFT_314475 [Hypoxylon sp. NC0597]
MANLGALTTTYTPSGTGCQSIHIGTTNGITWIQQGTISDCFPSNFKPQDGYYYSPGICMQSYSYAREVNVGGGLSSITAATCCPSGFVSRPDRSTGDPNACLSGLTSDSSYVVDVITYVDGSPTKIGTTAVLCRSGDLVFAKGLVVWRASNDIEWPNPISMSSTTTIDTLTSPSSTPIATASMPVATGADNSIDTGTATFTHTTSPTSDIQNTSNLSAGAKAGIGLGVSFGSLLFLGVVAGVYLASRRKDRDTKDDPTLIHNAAGESHFYKMPSYELDEQRRTLEMSAQREPAELMSSYP